MPFFKFSVVTDGPNGPERVYHFINALNVAKADYHEADGVLRLYVNREGEHEEEFLLQGDEALEALKRLQGP